MPLFTQRRSSLKLLTLLMKTWFMDSSLAADPHNIGAADIVHTDIKGMCWSSVTTHEDLLPAKAQKICPHHPIVDLGFLS